MPISSYLYFFPNESTLTTISVGTPDPRTQKETFDSRPRTYCLIGIREIIFVQTNKH